MIERIAELVNGDADLVRRGRYVDTTFLVEVGDDGYLIRVHEGRVVSVTPGPFITPNYSFALRAPREAWEKFWQPAPEPGWNDIFALFKQGLLRIEGDLHPFMANLIYFKDLLASPRKAKAPLNWRIASERGERERSTRACLEPINGRYLNLDLLGRPHRLYFEEAGAGIPLLCLHTAGSDGRQFRGLLNDARVTDNHRVIAFDMPWHGKSSPPVGWQEEEYRLTSRDYVRMICEVADALGLDKPVVMGCSIGGRIALYLAHQCPDRFRAIIGLESSPHVAPYYDVSWLNRPDVHGGQVCAGVVSGLVAPTAPDKERWETLWHYMQGGPGVFKGDLHFYKVDGDIRDQVGQIDGRKANLYLLTGEYDYSCTTEATLEIARRTGATAAIMQGLGHFPMSEDPPRFVSYLLPVLEKIRAAHG
jgi:pimeloyl-ACP methyl ester carboxylesterase